MSENHRSFGGPRGNGTTVLAHGHNPPSSEVAPGNGGNVDRVLFKNLVEMVPLVESLMDRRANSSFTRRASVVYTATPSQLKKVTDPRGRRTAQTVSAKKRRDLDDAHKHSQDGSVDDSSIFSSRASKDRDDLVILREQVDALNKKLLEKEEALRSAEDSKNQMTAAYASLDELRSQVSEKDSLIKSTNSQLYNAKIKLADKQAALEKLEWEAKMSNRKVEELQGDVVSMDLEITALMQIFEELSNNSSAAYPDDKTTYLFQYEQLPFVDAIDETEMNSMEEARTTYLAAVAAAKENPSDESLAMAAEARLRLQAFVL